MDRHEHGCEHELDAESDSSLIAASGWICSEIETETATEIETELEIVTVIGCDRVSARVCVDELCWMTNNHYWELEMVAADNR